MSHGRAGGIYVASVKWVFQVVEDGWRRFWLEGVELGKAKVESVEDVVARITEEAVDRGAEWEKRRVRVRMIARIRVEGRDGESSTAYYAYVDGERYVLSRNPHLLLRMAGAGRYQQVFRRYGFDYIMDYGASEGRAHDSPAHRVKSLPNG